MAKYNILDWYWKTILPNNVFSTGHVTVANIIALNLRNLKFLLICTYYPEKIQQGKVVPYKIPEYSLEGLILKLKL